MRALLRILYHANVRQVAIALGEIQSVTNDEFIGNLETHVSYRYVAQPPLGFIEQGSDPQRLGLALFQQVD